MISSMGVSTNTVFAHLFRKYRLRSEFETLHEFGDALASMNIIYDNSIFSRWQKGQKVPTDRKLLLAILMTFINRDGVRTLQEANSFMEAAGQGYLTDAEILSLPPAIMPQGPFQVPKEPPSFIGRAPLLQKITALLVDNKTVLLSGASGIGKTSIAVRIGHMLRDKFPDGVLWYKVEESTIMNILASIAYTYGKDVSNIKDLESRAAIVRSILCNKKILMILDNAGKSAPLNLILPTSPSAVLVTSTYQQIDSVDFDVSMTIDLFTINESFQLIETILGKKYVNRNKQQLSELIYSVGCLPLAISILAKMLKAKKLKISTTNKDGTISLASYFYDNKNLQSVMDLSFTRLTSIEKQVFMSLGVFKDLDFSVESVAAVAGLPLSQTYETLMDLQSYSLIERSTEERFRVNTIISQYLDRLLTPVYFQKLVHYYVTFWKKLTDLEDINILEFKNDIDNTILLFKEVYRLKMYKEVIEVWHELCWILWEIGEWSLGRQLGELTYSACDELNDLQTMKSILCAQLNYMNYWQIEVQKAIICSEKAVALAADLPSDPYTAFIQLRLERLYRGTGQKSTSYTIDGLIKTISTSNNHTLVSGAYLIRSDFYIFSGNLDNALQACEQSKSYALKIQSPRDRINILNLIYSQLALIQLMHHDENAAELILEESAQMYTMKKIYRIGSDFWNNLALAVIYELRGKKIETLEHSLRMEKAVVYLGIRKYLNTASALYYGLKTYLPDSNVVRSI